MDRELIELRARVEMLERALTSGHRVPGRFPRRQRLFMCGLMAITATVTAVVFELPVTLRGAGPTKVIAPFTVTDAAGHPLVTVEAVSGTGKLTILDQKGTPVVSLNASSKEGGSIRFLSPQGEQTATLGSQGDGTGVLRVFGKGAVKAEDFKVRVGVSPSNTGVITLNGTGQRALGMVGNGQIFGRNAAGKEAMSLGVDNADQGYFIANKTGGEVAATLAVGGDGTGMLQVFKVKGELGAVVGVREGTKGDVCANGPNAEATKSPVCLSTLSVKTFLPY